MVGPIVAWYDALKGSLPLPDGLSALLEGLGAEAGMLVRTEMQDLRPLTVAAADRKRGLIAPRPLYRSFADSYFGEAMAHAQAGSIWIASAHADDSTGDPALDDWQGARQMKEMVVIVLSAGKTVRDHIELHYRNRLGWEDEVGLSAIVPDLVRVWAGRRKGLVADNTAAHHPREMRGKARMDDDRYILSADNPARLSRAEFRVCLLLSRGLLIQAVAHELKLADATIRTHLRNIYAKTGVHSLPELVFRLLKAPAAEQAGSKKHCA